MDLRAIGRTGFRFSYSHLWMPGNRYSSLAVFYHNLLNTNFVRIIPVHILEITADSKPVF